jgi:hypothetical protein
MKTMMLIPTLAVALVTASASLTAALACNPPAGQCCTGDWFHENGRGLPQERRHLEWQDLPEPGRRLQGERLELGRQELQAASAEPRAAHHDPTVIPPTP